MKKLSFIVLIISLITYTSCKQNEAKNVVEDDLVVEAIVKPKQLTIQFNFKTNKSDVFKIMMNNIEVDGLQKKNIHIFENVTPSTSEDQIIAKFDEGDISKNIIIHLGNKTIKEVEITSVQVSYGDNHLNITTPEDLDKYFAFNNFIDFDSASNKLKTIKVNGQHNPAFSLKHSLINFITK